MISNSNNTVKIYEGKTLEGKIITGQLFELARYSAVFIVNQYSFLEDANKIPIQQVEPSSIKYIREESIHTKIGTGL